jgi:hypothetical protein
MRLWRGGFSGVEARRGESKRAAAVAAAALWRRALRLIEAGVLIGDIAMREERIMKF